MYQDTSKYDGYHKADRKNGEQTAQMSEIDYAHPDFYRDQELQEVEAQSQPQGDSNSPQPKQERPPTDNPYAGYEEYAAYSPTIHVDPYAQEYRGPQQMEGDNPELYRPEEYRGPQQMQEYTAEYAQQQAAQEQPVEAAPKKRGFGRIGSAIVALGAFLLKFQSIAFILKFGLSSLSIFASVAVYALFYGWTFAIGIVAQLFIHEMGHAVVMKLKNIPMGGMVFIPMFGAAVTMKQMPQNARDEAEVGIAGPIAGTLAATFCLLMAHIVQGPSIWAPLAYFGFFINLFNLIPIVPFDGGRVLAAIDKRIWFLGFALLLGFQIWQWLNGTFTIWLLLFILLAAGQLWSRGMSPNTAEQQAYYNVPVASRIALTLLYFGLLAVLVLGMTMAHGLMPLY